MIDPVSTELAARESVRMPWRWALFGAAVVHLAVVFLLASGSSGHSRPLTLPKVQVRIGALPMPIGGKISPGPAAAPAKPLSPPAKPAHKPVAVPPRPANDRPGKTVDTSKKPRSDESNAPVASFPPDSAADNKDNGSSGGQTGVKSPAGIIGLGQGNSGTDENFPYSYYLNRLLAMIENNWFKPDAQAGARCRLRCRIDRTGRLIEVGVEESSSIPAFDRAALRAVYAAAPFPPMPQGYSGSSLTLHLEFGP